MSAKETASNKKSRKTFLIILIIVLLSVNAFFIFKLVKKNQSTTAELISTEQLKDELEKEVADYKDQVAMFEEDLELKDTAIIRQKREIEEKVKEIEKLIKAGEISQANYRKAKEEIEQLKYYVSKYQAEIKELKKKNRQLEEEVSGLKTEITQRNKDVDSLMDQTTSLGNKLDVGKMLRAEKFYVTGVQLKRDGNKEKETLKGKRMDGIRVDFKIKDNILAEKGNKVFYVKIIDPKGVTLFIEERGSGSFTYQGEEVLYTIKETLDFDNSDKTYSIYWHKGTPFEEGPYEIVVYNDGLKIGKSSFEIK
jgi:myosin heavy subunit